MASAPAKIGDPLEQGLDAGQMHPQGNVRQTAEQDARMGIPSLLCPLQCHGKGLDRIQTSRRLLDQIGGMGKDAPDFPLHLFRREDSPSLRDAPRRTPEPIDAPDSPANLSEATRRGLMLLGATHDFGGHLLMGKLRPVQTVETVTT